MTLTELFAKHGSDKESGHHYGPVYEWLLSGVRPDLRLVEIGVLRGASLRAWEEYFPQGEIVGVDTAPRCEPFQRARLVVGDATKPATFDGLGDFDVVIDDGSHLGWQQLATWRLLWPRTRFLYVIEDVIPEKSARTLDVMFNKLRGETRHWRNPDIKPTCWTIFAKELLAMRRLP